MVDTSIRDILVAVKCPKERQMEVELELTAVFGWSVDDLNPSGREPLTHVMLTMNAHTVIYQDKNTVFQITCHAAKRVQRMSFLS